MHTNRNGWCKNVADGCNKLPVRNLAHLLTALLLAKSDLPMQVAATHIQGTLNVNADALLCFSKHPSWGSLMEDKSLDSHDVLAHHMPWQLLLTLWSVATSPKIADTSEPAMRRLWRLKLQSLPDGWRDSALMTSL